MTIMIDDVWSPPLLKMKNPVVIRSSSFLFFLLFCLTLVRHVFSLRFFHQRKIIRQMSKPPRAYLTLDTLTLGTRRLLVVGD